jgi:hypothetical protein
VQVHAVGLGALQQADVLQACRRRRQRLHQVAQHLQVGVHLLALAPARYQPGELVDGRVDDVGDVAEPLGRTAAGLRVAQVEVDVAPVALPAHLGLAPRHGDHVVAVGEEALDGSQPDETAGSGDQHRPW